MLLIFNSHNKLEQKVTYWDKLFTSQIFDKTMNITYKEHLKHKMKIFHFPTGK